MNAKILLILLMFFVILIIYPVDYQTRISLKIKNLSAYDIDSKIADEIQKELLNIFELKDFVIFSNPEECNIYLKFKPFLRFKNSELRIQNIIHNIANKFKIIDIEYNESFDKKYKYIFVVSSEFAKYKNLKDISDKFIEKLYLEKLKFKNFPILKKEIIAEILFKNADLAHIDMNISELKNLIFKTNIINNSFYDENYDIFNKVDFEYKNKKDIENTLIYFADNKNSLLMKHLFEIEIKEKKDDSCIFLNNHNAYVVAIMPSNYFQGIILQNKFNKLKTEFPDVYNFYLYKISKLHRHDYVFYDDKNIDELYDFYKKIYKKNSLFLINTPFVNQKFFEEENKKITVLDNNFKMGLNYTQTICEANLDELYNKKIEFLRKNPNFYAFGLNKRKVIFYKQNPILLNEYHISRQQVMDSILAHSEGLYLGFYFDGEGKISLYLKNKEANNWFLYSNYYKSLIPIDALSYKRLSVEYNQLVRKGDKYCFFVKKSKNPL